MWTLRRYRDEILAKTWYGRTFIHLYYSISPHLVNTLGKIKIFRLVWKVLLDKIVLSLRSEGIEDTPYADKDWL